MTFSGDSGSNGTSDNLWPTRPRRGKRVEEKSPQKVRHLPDRVSTVELGQRRVRNARTGEVVSADDRIVDGVIERALRQAKFNDVVELYRLLDEEENKELATPDLYVSPYRLRKMKKEMQDFIVPVIRDVHKLAMQLHDLELIDIDDQRRITVAKRVEALAIVRRKGAH